MAADRPPPEAVHRRSGVLWSQVSPEPIPWAAIREVRIAYGVGQYSFDVVLTHPEAVRARWPSAVRSTGSGRARESWITIAPGGLDHGIDEAIGAIDRFRPNIIRRVE